MKFRVKKIVCGGRKMTFAEFRAEHSEGAAAAKGDVQPTDIYTFPSADGRAAEYSERPSPDAEGAVTENPTDDTVDTEDKNSSAPVQSAADTDTTHGEGKVRGGKADGRGLILEYYDEQLVARAGEPEREPGIFDKIPFLRTKRGRVITCCAAAVLCLAMSVLFARAIAGEETGIAPSAVTSCEHTFETVPGDKVTCLQGGTGRIVCSKCGFVKGEVDVPALGHDYVKSGEEATCEKSGRVRYTCSRCGDSYSEEQPKLGHDYEITDMRKSCVEAGDVKSVCKRCGHTEITHIAAGSHKWLRQTNRAATCTSNGEYRLTCLSCGAKSTEVIPAKGHSFTETVTKEATCTEPGTVTRKCSVCSFSEEEQIAAKGHTYALESQSEPTCYQDGEKVYKCSVCGDSYTERIATSGHDFSEATCEKAATCKKCGLESGRKAAHKYERGACIWCGAAEPAAPTEPSEPVTEPTEPSEPPLEPIEP